MFKLLKSLSLAFFFIVLGKLASSQVSMDMETGTANVSIPLFQLPSPSMSFPVSLGYNTGGIRVDEKASIVGLGWNLQGGGSVIRVVNGLPDEQRTDQLGNLIDGGWLQSNDRWVTLPANSIIQDDFIDAANGSISNLVELDQNILSEVDRDNISNGKFDVEPDEFYIDAPGLSAKFIFSIDDRLTAVSSGVYAYSLDQNGLVKDLDVPVFFPAVDLKVEYTRSANQIESFIVTNTNGFRYYFTKKEVSISRTALSISELVSEVSYASAWYLERIEDSYGNIEVEYEYVNQQWQNSWITNTYNLESQGTTSTGIGEVSDYGPNGDGLYDIDPCVYPYRRNEITVSIKESNVLLSTVTTKFGELKFIYDHARQDRSGFALSRIDLKDDNGVIKRIQLEYGYFVNKEYDESTNAYIDSEQKRLKLLSVQFVNSSYEPQANPIKFYYSNEWLPTYESNSIDHWGFFNQQQNESKIPVYDFNFPYVDFTKVNREVGNSMGFNLVKVEYSEGGYEQFEFEQHEIAAIREADNIQPLITPSEIVLSNLVEQGMYNSLPFYNDENVEISEQNVFIENDQVVRVDLNINFSEYDFAGFGDCGQVNRRFELRVYSENGTFLSVMFDNSWDEDHWNYSEQFNSAQSISEFFEFYLPAGNYTFTTKLVAHCRSHYTISAESKLSFAVFSDRLVPVTRTIGGLRVKSITVSDGDQDHTNDIIRRYEYLRNSPNQSVSSGVLLNKPVYKSTFYNYSSVGLHHYYFDGLIDWIIDDETSDYYITHYHCDYEYANSFVSQTQDMVKGMHLLYSSINEYLDMTGDAGHINYTFEINSFPSGNETLIGGYQRMKSWRNTSPKGVYHYNSGNLLLKSTEYEYQSKGLITIPGLSKINAGIDGHTNIYATGMDHDELIDAVGEILIDAAINGAMCVVSGGVDELSAVGFAIDAAMLLYIGALAIMNEDLTINEDATTSSVKMKSDLMPYSYNSERYNMIGISSKGYLAEVPGAMQTKEVDIINGVSGYGNPNLRDCYTQGDQRISSIETRNTDLSIDRVYKKFNSQYDLSEVEENSQSPMLLALLSMQNHGMSINVVEELYTEEFNPLSGIEGEYIIGGRLTTYRVNDQGKVVVDEQYSLDLEEPIIYDESFWSSSENSNFVFNENYSSIVKILSQDNYGAPNSFSSTTGMNFSVLRDGQKGQVVAKILNADPNEVRYTSFESENHFGWNVPSQFGTSANLQVNPTLARTGLSAFPTNLGSISTSISDGEYVLSFWLNNSGTVNVSGANIVSSFSENVPDITWKYYEYVLLNESGANQTISISVSGNNILMDELRLCPSDAHMTTYCFSKGRYLNTVCSSSNFCEYYVYDNLDRATTKLNNTFQVLSDIERTWQDPANTSDFSELIVRQALTPVGIQNFPEDISLLNQDYLTSKLFYDGMGRLVQAKGIRSAPNDGTYISQNKYNEYGKVDKYYLPYVRSTYNVEDFETNFESAQGLFYQNTEHVAQSDSPFGEIRYNDTPFQRALEYSAPGEQWQMDAGHTMKSDLRFNSYDQVLMWYPTENNKGAQAISNGVPRYWPSNQLTKVISTDENGKEITSFYNIRQQLVLVRYKVNSFENESGSYTTDRTQGTLENVGPEPNGAALRNVEKYFVYDAFGQRIFEISNQMLEGLEASSNGYIFSNAPMGVNYEIFNGLGFGWQYDKRGRLIKSKSPGVAEIFYVYNNRDQLVMSQDAKLRLDNAWSVIRYDKYGRCVYSGITTTTENYYDVQAEINSSSILVEEFNGGPISGYSNNGPYGENLEVWDIFFFDNYNFDTDGLNFSDTGFLKRTKGLSTGSKRRVISNDESVSYLTDITYYNQNGMIANVQTSNVLGGSDSYEFHYTWRGQLSSVIRYHQLSESTQVLKIKNTFVYDRIGRLMDVTQRTGEDPEIILNRNEYNQLGQLVKQHLHIPEGNDIGMQVMDYRYNIRGWLRKINNSNLVDDNDNEEDFDVFGIELLYTEGDWLNDVDGNKYASNNALKPIEQSNGLIAAVKWNTKNPDEDGVLSAEKTYVYRYDDAYRMTGGYFASENQVFGNEFGNFSAQKNFYTEKVDYNLNDGIVKLKRYRPNTTGVSPELSDNLSYEYYENSYKLKKVTDNSTSITLEGRTQFEDNSDEAVEYNYDESGNLIEDKNKGHFYAFNQIGLVSQIWNSTPEDATIHYEYGSNGALLKKSVGDRSWLYVSGIEYSKVGSGEWELVEIKTGSGVVRPKMATENNETVFVYDYFIKDHLGNVRAVVTEGNAEDVEDVASMEDTYAVIEEVLFDNVDVSRIQKPFNYPYVNSNDGKAAGVGGSGGTVYGPSRLMKIPGGSKVTVEATAWYEDGLIESTNQNVSTVISSALLTLLMQGEGIMPGGERGYLAFGDPNSAPASSLSNFLLGEFDDEDPNRPKAHLFYVVFNRDLIVQPKLSGSIMVGSPDELKVLETVLAVPEDGYVFTFLTNYSLKKVFFDNLTIRHKQGVVRARYDYYPYGLMWGNPPVDSKYDETYAEGKWGQGEWGEEGIELYQYSLRFYNPVLGNFISPDPYEQFDSPYAANFNNPANFADPSGGVASYFFCVIGETLNFGNVSGGASSATAVLTATGIIMDINQSLASAGPELMQEYVNATGGPGGFVVQTTGENMGSYAWDPSATPDSPGFIPPGQSVWLSSGECLYYTSQTDVHVEHRTLGEVEIVSTSIMSTEAKVMLALDILENFVPGLNLAIAAGKAAYYLTQGNIAEVGWAVAGLFGGDIIRAVYTVGKASIKAVKYSAKAVRAIAAPTKAVKKVDEVVAAVDEVAEVTTKKADDVWYEIRNGDVVSWSRKKPKDNTPYTVVNDAGEVVEEAPGGLNLFKWEAEQTGKATGWNVGDYMLYLPKQATPKLNWKANYSSLRIEMNLNRPIFDSYRFPDGSLIPTGGFLHAERFTLQSRGWIYNAVQGAWLPPIR